MSGNVEPPGLHASKAMTFVVVVFEAEWNLLEFLVGSVRRYVPRSVCTEIVVIDNGDVPLHPRFWSRLERQAAGGIPMRLLRREEIVVDMAGGTAGWRTQQVLKLAVSNHVSTPFYTLLDAKNHAIRPVRVDDLVADDLRAHGGRHSYRGHPLEGDVRGTLAYLGLDPEPHIAMFPTTATPFVMITAQARALVAHLESEGGLANTMAAHSLLEFPLYSAWLLSQGLTHEDVYTGQPIECPTIWPRMRTTAEVEEVIALADAIDSPFFAVHRTALARLSSRSCRAIIAFWRTRRLVRSQAAGARFIGTFRVRWLRTMSARRLRSTLRARRRPRRP